jgi:branched-chain amino acid transport system substrate-binding protein
MFSRRALLLGLGATAAAAAHAGAFAAAPIRIGVSLGLSGMYQRPSLMHQRSYEMWVDEVNARGGLLGRPVVIDIRDDHSDAGTAAAIYRQFVQANVVDLVFGPYSSELTAAVAPIVDAAGCPMLASGAASDAIWSKGFTHVFAILTPASRYAQGVLRLARDNGLSRIAILHADDSFSSEIAQGARRWAPYLELETVADMAFSKGTADLTEQMSSARAAGAELVVVAGHVDEAINGSRALAEIGWKPCAFFATVGPALPDWPALTEHKSDAAMSMSNWEPGNARAFPGSREFAMAFRARFGFDPSYQAATAYAAGQILEQAIVNAGAIARKAVTNSLLTLDVYTVVGRYAVDASGQQRKRIDMVVQWQEGRKQIVWPRELATARPLFNGCASR